MRKIPIRPDMTREELIEALFSRLNYGELAYALAVWQGIKVYEGMPVRELIKAIEAAS